jgi:hypothetical protein
MDRQGKNRASSFAAFACSAVLACSAAFAVEPPSWWNDPNRGSLELVFEKGSSGKCPTEEAARQKAYDAGLATLRKRITDNTNLWPWIQLVGTDIAFEWTQEDSWGKWYAWVLVSYPRAQFEKALRRAEERAEEERQRAEEAAAKALERTRVYVFPMTFGKESEEQFPEVVKKNKALGYGNAIWETVEDLLYENGFEIFTVPSSKVPELEKQFFDWDGSQEPQPDEQLPDKAIRCNMNFFPVETESTSWFRVVRNSDYHAELLLDFREPHSNVKIPAKGEALDKDLLVAIQKAAEQAVGNLVARERRQREARSQWQ